MNNGTIYIYSKKDGVNQLLLETTDSNLVNLKVVFENKKILEHMSYAYALVQGIEIKLF